MTLIGTSAPWQNVAMPAVDLRRMLAVAVTSEGVQGTDDFKVSQRAAGANMSVDVASGKAYVTDDHAGSNAGGVYWAQNDAVVNLTIAAADATNPRIDRVILEVRDAFLGDAANDWRLRVLTGTPTSGANLTNLSGAAAVPDNALLLANVQVDAGATSITDAKIDTGVRSRIQAPGGITIYRSTSTVDVTNTAVETTILSQSIGAGILGTDKMIRVTIEGDYVDDLQDAHTARLKYGATTVATVPLNLQQAGTRKGFSIEAVIANLGVTNSQLGRLRGRLEHSGGDGSPLRVGTAAEDSTVAQTLAVTFQFTTARAARSFRKKYALVEVV